MIRTQLNLTEKAGGSVYSASGSDRGTVRIEIDVALASLDADEMRFLEALLEAVKLAPSMLARDQRLREAEQDEQSDPEPIPLPPEPETPAPTAAVGPVDGAGEGGEAETPEPEAPPAADDTDAVPPAPRPVEFPAVERTWETVTPVPVKAKPGRKPNPAAVEVDGVRMDPTSGKLRQVLDTLAGCGGALTDADGLAGVKLYEQAGQLPGTGRSLLSWLDRGGYVERDVRAGKTYRVALTAKGWSTIGATPPDPPLPDEPDPELAKLLAEEVAIELAATNGHTAPAPVLPSVVGVDTDDVQRAILDQLARLSVFNELSRANLELATRCGVRFSSDFIEKVRDLVEAGLVDWDERDKHTQRIAITPAGRAYLSAVAS